MQQAYAKRCGVRASAQGLARHVQEWVRAQLMKTADAVVSVLRDPVRGASDGGRRRRVAADLDGAIAAYEQVARAEAAEETAAAWNRASSASSGVGRLSAGSGTVTEPTL